MNAKSYRVFTRTLQAITKEIGAIATPKPREPVGNWRVVDKRDKNIELEFTYYEDTSGTPCISFGTSGTKITNLTTKNLVGHFTRRMEVIRQERAEWALQELQSAASDKAELEMVKLISLQLSNGFKPGTTDVDNPIWRSPNGWFKLAYIHVSGPVNNFVFSYNIEYDLMTPPARDTYPLELKGEFTTGDHKQIIRTLATLRSLVK